MGPCSDSLPAIPAALAPLSEAPSPSSLRLIIIPISIRPRPHTPYLLQVDTLGCFRRADLPARTSVPIESEPQPQSCRTERRSCMQQQPLHALHKALRLTRPRSLYRRSLKLALDWAVSRHMWRGQALYLRSLFEANKNVIEPRQQRVRPNGIEVD